MSTAREKPSTLIGKLLGSQPQSQAVQASYERSVFLTDWWLIEVESNSKERRLGVEGFPSRGRQAVRLFHSAPIRKRHDAVTLETEDDITVLITSFMNISRTLGNGFPLEVCNRFLSGFPHYWEEISGLSFDRKSTKNNGPSTTSSAKDCDTCSDDVTDSSLPMSLDDLPVTRVRNLLMFSDRDSAKRLIEQCISNYIPRKEGDDAFKDDITCGRTTGKSNRQEFATNKSRLAKGDSSNDASPKNQTVSNHQGKSKVQGGTRSTSRVNTRSMKTRSMSKSSNLWNKK